MKEQTRKVVDVLGIDVSVVIPEKAVNITMNYINRKELSTVFFHTAESSLFSQSHDWAAQCVDSCNLVLPGDIHMEYALAHTVFEGEGPGGNGKYAEDYLRRLMGRLSRESREIFIVVPSQEKLESMREEMTAAYPSIRLDGGVLPEESEVETESLVNEINGTIPDAVFLCLPPHIQLNILKEYVPMMNTHLVICIEDFKPSVLTGARLVPEWVEALHLTGIYQWFRKEHRIRERIVGSIFKKTVEEEKKESMADESDRIEPEEDSKTDSE